MPAKNSILIIEETPLHSNTILTCLQSRGLKAERAGDIRSATHLAQTKNITLIIVCIGEEGPEESLAIAASAFAIRLVPLIYISAFPLNELLRRVKDTIPGPMLSTPLREPDLIAQVELALSATKRRSGPMTLPEDIDHIFVPVARGYIRIRTSEIRYILSDSNYCKVYFTPEGLAEVLPGKSPGFLHVNVPMGTLYQKLPYFFYKLSRFEVINLRKIESIERKRIFIGEDEREIPEGRRTSLLAQLRVIKRN